MPPLEGIGIITTLSSIEDDSSNEKERQQPQRGVRFADDSNLRNVEPTIHISDYSIEEKSAAWYVLGDLKRFKKERRETVKRIKEGKPLCPNLCCARGLLTSEEKRRHREESITHSLEAVMKEQERQHMIGCHNDEMIAAAYGVFSLPSIERAQHAVLLEGDDECRDTPMEEEAVWTRI